MFAIIKNIQRNITIDDLEKFVTSVIHKGFFQKENILKALKIIKVVDSEGKQIERHGLFRLSSENSMKQVINSLNGHLIGDQTALVDEYRIRDWHNDRRSEPLSAASIFIDKRAADRRRQGLRKVAVSEKLIFKPIG